MSTHSKGLSDGEGTLLVKPKTAWRMLGCSNTHGYALLAAGELDSFRDGRARKITVASIHRYIARHLAESMGKRGQGRPRKIISAQPVAAAAISQEAQVV
jgi:excisionase family DNA binding protein